jgi:hypothetical protein
VGHPPSRRPGRIRQGGEQIDRLQRKRSSEASKVEAHRKRMVGDSRMPSRSGSGEGQRHRRRNWVDAVDGVSGVIERDMSRKSNQRKHGTSRGSPRPAGTAKAPRITSTAGKSRRACERGGWGRLSVDGPGQNNPDRSEGPWGRAAQAAQMAASHRAEDSTLSEPTSLATDDAKDGGKRCGVLRRRHEAGTV